MVSIHVSPLVSVNKLRVCAYQSVPIHHNVLYLAQDLVECPIAYQVVYVSLKIVKQIIFSVVIQASVLIVLLIASVTLVRSVIRASVYHQSVEDLVM